VAANDDGGARPDPAAPALPPAGDLTAAARAPGADPGRALAATDLDGVVGDVLVAGCLPVTLGGDTAAVGGDVAAATGAGSGGGEARVDAGGEGRLAAGI